MVDISDLNHKVENQGANQDGKLTAAEWNRTIEAILENQTGLSNSVKSIKLDSRDPEYPDENGMVTLKSVSEDAVLRFVFKEDYPSEIISTSGSIPIEFRFFSQNENEEDTGESVELKIQEYTNGSYIDRYTLFFSARPSTSTVFDSIDLADYFSNGTRQIRLFATGQETGKTTTKVFNITLTKLSITNVTAFESVQKVASTGSIQFRFAIGGNIPDSTDPSVIRSKRLVYEVETYYNNVRQAIGGQPSIGSTTIYSTTNPYILTIPLTLFTSHTSGVYTLKAKLQYINTVDGVESIIEETPYTFVQILVEENNIPLTHPYIIIQDIKSTLVNENDNIKNYESINFLEYAIYNPTDTAITTLFELTNNSKTQYYWSGNLEVPSTATDQNITRGTLNVMAEVEDAVNDNIMSFFNVYLNNTDTNFLLYSLDTTQVAIGGIAYSQYNVRVDNTEKFVPTQGADLFINPKLRSNNESNPATMQNAAKNNELITTTFTNVNFIDGIDGWTTADGTSNSQKVLKILAGSEVAIQYYPFYEFATNSASNMTLELDFAVKNVLDEEESIIKIYGKDSNDRIYGVQIKPLEGVVMTKSKRTYGEQDFHWQEGVRTHVMINILSQYRPTTDSSFIPLDEYTNGMPVIRVFINNVIQREIVFNKLDTEEFCPANAPQLGIVIGQQSADIDIYSIRCYKGQNGALNITNCKDNYAVSLPTGVEKAEFRERNDILTDDKVDYNKASAKYNTLIWHGPMPYGANDSTKSDTEGWLELRMLDGNHQIIPNSSGTFCRDTKKMPCKGQGTTAKTYFYWNLQWDLSKVKAKTIVDGEEVIDGYRRLDGSWVGSTYAVDSSVVAGQKMVMKINYASSMQSHKQGATALYNDLYRRCVGATEIQSYQSDDEYPYANTRVTVLEKEVLFFVQETETSEIKFMGLGTFGPGKMDKKTWGYDKKVFPDFAMFEGADNNRPLTDMRVPWGTDEGLFDIKYDAKEEAYMYNGAKNINFDAGKTNDKDKPIGNAVTAIRAAWNFLFNHNPRIQFYDGNYTSFITDFAASKLDDYTGPEIDLTYQYYMRNSDNNYSDPAYRDAYNLFRYDFKNDDWVPAGYDAENDLNVRKNLVSLYGVVPYSSLEQERDLYAYRIAKHAKEGLGTDTEKISDYFNVNSLLFHYAFVVMFLAGTDNCSKNTYYVVSPFSHKIEMHQDDLDTTFKTDNSGFQLKPYYIDRIHNGLEYYEGNANVLNDLLELMYEGEHTYAVNNVLTVDQNRELRDTMRNIFNEMTSLVSSDSEYENSPFGCIDKYFFSIQRYFPEIAYNETARLRYEIPEYIGYRSVGRNVAPITQSLGDQLQSEIQYIKQRLVLMTSFASYGDFSVNSTNNLGLTRGDTSGQNTFMHLQSALYLYPNFRNGQSLIPQPYQYHLMEKGDNFDLNIGTGDGTDTAYGLNGKDYFYSFGDLSDYTFHRKFQVDTGLSITGKKLKEFKILDDTSSTKFHIAGGLTITDAPIFEELIIHSPKFSGPVNITSLKRIKVIDLAGTGTTSITLPNSPNLNTVNLSGTQVSTLNVQDSKLLTTLLLPSTLERLSIGNCPNLTTFSIDNYNTIQEIRILGEVGFNTLNLVRSSFNANTPLQTLVINNIDWSGVSQSMMMWICDIPNVTLTGRISMSSLDFEGKVKLIQKFGDIDSEDNPLYITYIVSAITNIYITGEGYFCEDDKVVEYKKDWRGNFILDSENNKIKTRPALNGLRRDVFNDGIEVEENGVFKYNGNIIKAYRVVSDNDGQNSVSSAKWSISGDGVTNRYFELVHPTTDGGWESHDTDKQYTDMVCYIRCIKPIVDSDDDFDDNVADTLINISVSCSSVSSSVIYTTQYRGVRAYNRKARRGDFVYHDGWYDGLTVLSQSSKYMKIKDIDSDWFNLNNIELVDTSSMPSISEQFELLTEQPSNWSTHFKRYYTYDGTNYNLITNSSAPTFASNTYYFARYRRYVSGTSHELAVYIVRDTDGHWVRNKEVVGICFYISDQDPTDRRMFAACIEPNTTSMKRWGINPSNFPNPATGVLGLTYQDPFDNLYNLTTSQPSNWETNYADYYIKDANDNFYHVEGDTAPTWTADTYYSKVAEKNARISVPDTIDITASTGYSVVLGTYTMRVVTDSFVEHKMRPLLDSEFGAGYSNPASNPYLTLHIGKRNILFGSQSDVDEYNSTNREKSTLNKLHKVGLAEYIQSEQGQSVYIPIGQYDTFAILLWRNRTLMGTDITIGAKETTVFKEYINGTESDELLYQVDTSKDKLVSDNNTSAIVKLSSAQTAFNNATLGNNYDDCRLFPAASYACLYEPLVSKYTSELKEEYGIHRWWLPSSGEVCLEFVQMVCSEGFQEDDGSYAATNNYIGRRAGNDGVVRSWRRGERSNLTNGTSFNPDVDMFEMQTMVNMFREIKNGNPLKITDLAHVSNYWCSTEFNVSSTCTVAFSVASVYNGGKDNSFAVRPTATF